MINIHIGLPISDEWSSAPDWRAAISELRAATGTHALVARDDVQVNSNLADEVSRATTDEAVVEAPWLMLLSDGVGPRGPVDNGAFIDRPPRGGYYAPVAATSANPAVVVVDLARLKAVSGETIAELILNGWGTGHGSLISPYLRYSVPSDEAEYREVVRLPAPAGTPPLERFRPAPTVTIAIRTTLTRPRLLRRAVEAVISSSPLPDELLLVCSEADGTTEELDEFVPTTVTTRVLASAGGVPSRTANLVAAMEHASSDYVLFVDDDDWVAPDAIGAIRDAVHSRARPVVVGPSIVVTEDGDSVEHTRRYDPGQWFRAFTGWNPLPNCSVAIPRELALARMEQTPLRHDLGEDFGLLLLLLSAPRQSVEIVDTPLAFISIRPGGDNTVADPDQATWLLHRSSFMSDMVADPAASGAALWALGDAVLADIPFAAQRP